MSPKLFIDADGQMHRSSLNTPVSLDFGKKDSTSQQKQPAQSNDSKRPYSGEGLDRALKQALSGLKK